MLNVLTIDVEDYFHATVFEGVVAQKDWPKYESRVVQNTKRLLDIFSHYKVKVTFFVLGWVAENYPDLVKELHEAGHEIACHSYAHRLIYNNSKEFFREDIKKAKRILEEITEEKVLGYRAPTFSITTESLWAHQILKEEGFKYDSSLFPIVHDRYGIPNANRFPSRIKLNGRETMAEFPMSTLRILGVNIPISGGGYLRLFPYRFIKWAINRVNKIEQKPVVIYLHPWELDPFQPRINLGRFSEFRHYVNIDKMEEKLRRLLMDFEFRPAREILNLYID